MMKEREVLHLTNSKDGTITTIYVDHIVAMILRPDRSGTVFTVSGNKFYFSEDEVSERPLQKGEKG